MLAPNLLGVLGLTCLMNKFLFSHASRTPIELVNKLGMLVTLQYDRTINRKSTVNLCLTLVGSWGKRIQYVQHVNYL